jgi:hypothetical protein
MKRNLCLIALVAVILAGSVLAANFWEKKPYTQWSEKECRQLLQNSPWTYEFQWGRTGDIGGNVGGNNSDTATRPNDYERESVTMVRISLFSSRPVRQAYVALMAKGDAVRFEKMKDFATRDTGDEIILAWTLDSKPKRTDGLMDLERQLHALSVGELANNTFLATDTGKKVYIKDYIQPTPDGTGAKFVFPRNLEDGTPLIGPDVKTLRFQTKRFRIKDDEIGIDGTFKIGKMTIDGKLEY